MYNSREWTGRDREKRDEKEGRAYGIKQLRTEEMKGGREEGRNYL